MKIKLHVRFSIIHFCYRKLKGVDTALPSMRGTELRHNLAEKGLRRSKDFSYEGEVDRLIAIFQRVGAGQRGP